MALTPLSVKKKLFGLWGSWYSNRPARPQRLMQNSVLKYMYQVPRSYQKSTQNRSTKPAKIYTFNISGLSAYF